MTQNLFDEQHVFVIDLYDAARDKGVEVRRIFNLNGRQWAIKEVALEWGEPILERPFEEIDTLPHYHLFETLNEANEYVNLIKGMNAI